MVLSKQSIKTQSQLLDVIDKKALEHQAQLARLAQFRAVVEKIPDVEQLLTLLDQIQF